MDRDRDILARLDEHMERSNEHMARGNEHMRRGNELMEEIREQHRRSEETYKQGMEFMAHLAERTFGAIDESVRGLRALSEQIRGMRNENRREFEAIREEHRAEARETWAHLRAQTEALFKMLDRLDNGGGAATS